MNIYILCDIFVNIYDMGDIMGKPLMIQEDDDRRIKMLQKDFGLNTKIGVVRAGLALLEKEALRLKKIERWKKAAKLVAKQSQEINKEFQACSRIKHRD